MGSSTIVVASPSQGTKAFSASCGGEGPFVDNSGAVFSAFRAIVRAAGPTVTIMPPDAQTLLVQTFGNPIFGLPAPPGSTCHEGDAKYDLVIANGTLSFETCKVVDDGTTPFVTVSGTKVLTQEEMSTVVQVMSTLSLVPTETSCPPDVGLVALVVVSSPSEGAKRFDAGCGGDDPHLSDLSSVLLALHRITGG